MAEMKLIFYSNYPSICCCCSLSQFCPTLCDSMNGSMPGFPVLHCLPEFAQLLSFEYVMPSNHLILCSPLLLLPSIFSSIRVFSNESALCIRWSKYWSFSISSSSEYSCLISFRIYWFDLLALQVALKNRLQYHILKALILQHPAFFMVLISHPYMTTGKTLVLTIWTFVIKIKSWLFNTLSRFVIASLPKSKHLLIS